MFDNVKRNILTKKELAGMESENSFLKKIKLNSLSEIDSSVLELLREKHKQYINTISSAEMAASFELCVLLYKLAITLKPSCALDLGAGFSSYVLRLASKNSNNFTVYSVDDDNAWLQKTISYLKENDLQTFNVIGMEDFKKLNGLTLDLILLDLNFVEVRKNYIDTSIEMLNDKGILIFDDTHKIEYLRIVKERCLKNNISLFDFKSSTIDSFKRFALIGVK